MELALQIKGKIDGSVSSSMQKAINESKQLQSQVKRASAAMKEAEKMSKLERQASGSVNTDTQQKILSIQQEISKATSERAAKVKELRALEKAAAAETMTSGRASLATLNQLAAKKQEIAQLELKTSQNSALLKKTEALAKEQALATGKVSTATQEKLNSLQKELNAATERRTKILETQAAKETASAKFSKATGRLGAGIAMTAAAAAPLAAMIGTAAEYEKAMSKVKAITNASDTDMQKLSATAQELGSKTQFSASQAAEAMSYLGMAGWKTEQIISGMPGLLDLAAASGSNLATVADIVSDDLTAFGMSADQAGHMADVMAAASTNANTNVEMMGQTFKYAGAVAGSLGYSLEDVAVATGLMANAGIKADQAGTSLRAIMTRLVAPTKQSGTAMDLLGISVTNADGTMKPFMQTMEELRDAFSGLSDSEKAEKASMIAGQEAMSGFLSIVNASDEDFAKLSNAITNCDGAAARMAGTMNNNAKGGAVQLQSAIEAVSISIGQLFLPTVAEVARTAADVVGSVAKWAQEHQALVSVIIKAAAAFTGFILALLTANAAAAGINLLLANLAFLGVVQEGTTAGTLAATIANKAHAASAYASAAAQKVLSTSMKGIGPLMSAAASGMKAMGSAIMGVARAGLAAMFSPLGLAIMAIAAAGYLVYSNWATVGPMFQAMWNNITTAFQNAWTMLQPAIAQLTATFSMVANTIGTALSEAFARISALFTENSAVFETFGSILSVLAGIIGGVVVGAIVIMADVLSNYIVTAVNVAVSVITAFMGVLDGVINFVVGVFTGNWQQAWDGVAEVFSSVWNGIKAVADSILGGIMGTVSSVASSIGNLISKASNFVGGGGGKSIPANAEGGIYAKGAFLTTFAEEGPEAAIPLNGSPRALALWRQAGEIMGVLPRAAALSPAPASAPAPAAIAPAPQGEFSVELNAPITINGNADSSTVAQLESAIQRLKNELARDFGRQFTAYKSNQRRLSYD